MDEFEEKDLIDLLEKMPTRKATTIRMFDEEDNVVAEVGITRPGLCPLCGHDIIMK